MDISRPMCFVIMPIRKDGSDEHAHFKTLYNEFLKPPIEEAGYSVVRADNLPRSGAITRDVILLLAEAELVVADLTDLNPNVYYELGVRHALRGRGTLMILDIGRTPEIPFDLSAYRVIHFSSEMQGLTKLRHDLQSFVTGTLDPLGHPDNPVHDWLPALPSDLLASSQGTAEGKLREQLAQAKIRLREYEEKYGLTSGEDGGDDELQRAIYVAQEEVRAGALPSELMRKAAEARSNRDHASFLSVLERIANISTRLTADQWNSIAKLAQGFELDSLVGVIFEHGRKLHPSADGLRASQLSFFAHSSDANLRGRARRELMEVLGITKSEDGILIDRVSGAPNWKLGAMLDAFHRENLHGEALEITSAYVEIYPDNSLPMRNHARALGHDGRADEELEWYRKSVRCSDVDDTSWSWLGNEYFNRSRHIEAASAYCHACMMDPDDATYFARVAQALSWAIRYEMQGKNRQGTLPGGMTPSVIDDLIRATASCDIQDQRDLEIIEAAATRVGRSVSVSLLRSRDKLSTAETIMSLQDRFDLVTKLLTLMPDDDGSPIQTE